MIQWALQIEKRRYNETLGEIETVWGTVMADDEPVLFPTSGSAEQVGRKLNKGSVFRVVSEDGKNVGVRIEV